MNRIFDHLLLLKQLLCNSKYCEHTVQRGAYLYIDFLQVIPVNYWLSLLSSLCCKYTKQKPDLERTWDFPFSFNQVSVEKECARGLESKF